MKLFKRWSIEWVWPPKVFLGEKWIISWVYPHGQWFIWKGFRFNGGGYLYGAAPYTYWRIGPIFIRKYM